MGVDLLNDPVAPSALSRMVACVDRELGMRRKVYPRWVAAGKLTQDKATLELEEMGRVRAALLRGAALEEYVFEELDSGAVVAAKVDALEEHYAKLYPAPAVKP